MITPSSEDQAAGFVPSTSVSLQQLDAEQVVWDEAVFADLCETIGADTVHSIVARFRIDLLARFGESDNHEVLRRDAHAVASSSGMLGFARLSETAKAFEVACSNDGDMETRLRDLFRAKQSTLAHMAEPSNRGG